MIPSPTANTRGISRRYPGQAASDGAGVKLTRMFDARAASEMDPFLMLDEFRSDSAEDYLAGFPSHPHRGFETVTYMLAGRMRHADNQGNTGDLGPGSLQWMTAGRGIVHEEMPQQEDGLMWGYQLWVNLPASEKMTEPHYQDVAADGIPLARGADGIEVRVLSGSYGDLHGPVRERPSQPIYLDITLPANARWRYSPPSGHTVLVHGVSGEFRVGTESSGVQAKELALLNSEGDVELSTGDGGARCLLIAGRPFGEPVAHYGPFVMNQQSELEQAVQDYRSGRF